MNKIILNKFVFLLASVVAAVTFTSEASALPLFARQTGMECAACHFQHFPMLTAFGRSFKAGAFTMMGAQEKVEGDNLSIPAVLNAAILTTMGYQKNNSDSMTIIDPALSNNGIRSTGDGSVYVPGTNGEFSLFVGGRTSDFAGALAEVGLLQSGGVGAGLASAKFPMLWEVADGTRAGIVPFTTDGQGASYGFEELNTGANAVHTMLFIGGDFNGSVAGALSAQQYIGTAQPATGAALVLNNESYFVNVTKFHGVGTNDLGGTGAALTSTYLRAAYIFDAGGWDSAVGVQSWSGSSSDSTPGVLVETKATAIDGQMQGAVGGMPLGIYASYATAPVDIGNNIFNADPNTTVQGTDARSSFNISAELGVIPEKATVGFGFRRGKSGVAMAGSNNASDNAILLEGSYKLAQNMLMNLIYVSQSGDYWDAANTAALGSKETLVNLAVIW
jgi:hypothetical protein